MYQQPSIYSFSMVHNSVIINFIRSSLKTKNKKIYLQMVNFFFFDYFLVNEISDLIPANCINVVQFYKLNFL